MSSWTTLASGALPVSTRTRPSPVVKADTLAKEGQKPTPSVISTNPPMWSTGWKVVVESSPFHSRSATERTSGGMEDVSRHEGPHQKAHRKGEDSLGGRAGAGIDTGSGRQAPGAFSSAEGAGVSAAGEVVVVVVVLAVLPSSMPFSNWFLAEPRLRANLGMAAPPKRSTTRTMATINRSGPKMSASIRISFTRVHVAVNGIPG